MSSAHHPAPLQFSTQSGLTLQADTNGSRSNPPVLLAHGGGQTRHAWRNTGRLLADAGFYSICLDLRGHGASDWCPDGNYRIEAFANDLVDISAELRTPPILVGASLGAVLLQ
jgi:pimeloyl-ACP methyl ester carboxylesterase